MKNLFLSLFTVALVLSSFIGNTCTGIRLVTKDGGVIYGRSMEWGAFDLNSRVAIVPRGYTFTGLTPDGFTGKTYQAIYGVVGLDMLHKDLIADGMNEKGLTIGLFYHPGFAKYPEFEKTQATNTISAQEVPNYILTQFASVEEVKTGMEQVKVVGVVEPKLGIIVEGHWMVSDASGNSIVIEYNEGELKIFDAPLGVITNAPNYDWHLTNLRNHINLSMYSLPTKEIESYSFSPLGAGSGMTGLPGDNTPPSRFIRAVAWSQTARELPNAEEATYELFRILDNFQLPLGPDGAEGSSEKSNNDLMRSSTIWTTSWNMTDLKLNFHTQHNRRLRQLDLKKIDFSNMGDEIVHITMDEKKEQDILEIGPGL
ncbi:choloylglycine hydrolase family protein [bacterium SCSIO 12741]|nr:choloylglycine hydrolase family protein [bacterium SCSIO 12741]